jgi:rod shape-determining protein MreC
MRNFIDYLIKNTSSIIYLFLITIALTQIFSRNYYQNSVFNLYFSEIANSFINEKNNIVSYLNLNEENKRLVRENMYLLKESINSNYLSLDSIKKNNFELIPASIISNSIRFDKNFITLNVGDNDGVKIDDGIITKFGIIGIINKTSEKFSSGISLLNSEIKINAMIKKTNHFGSLFWDGLSHEKVKLTDIPRSANISKGDTIVSGGMSYIFPKNILIGVVEDYSIPKSTNYYDIKVRLFEDFGAIRNVFVIKNDSFDELKRLIENE